MPASPAPFRTIARRTSEELVPEGKASSPAWREIPRLSLVDTVTTETPSAESLTQVGVQWSPSLFYVAFWCRYSALNLYRDEDPRKERWQLWNRDVVEVFVNPFPENPHRYWEFEVAPNNQWIDLVVDNRETIALDASWDSGFSHATAIDEAAKIWFCEMGLPAASMGVSRIEPGMEWRINFYRCDGFGDDSQRSFLAWSPTLRRNFHIPDRFGWIRIED